MSFDKSFSDREMLNLRDAIVSLRERQETKMKEEGMGFFQSLSRLVH